MADDSVRELEDAGVLGSGSVSNSPRSLSSSPDESSLGVDTDFDRDDFDVRLEDVDTMDLGGLFFERGLLVGVWVISSSSESDPLALASSSSWAENQ